MIVRLVPSSDGSTQPRQHLTSLLVNDQVAFDSGSLGLLSPFQAQAAVRHVLISHSHIDHLATLPIFLDNVFKPGSAHTCPRLYASAVVWDTLHKDIFNDRVWPDLERIAKAESRFFEPHLLNPEQTLEVAGLRITPVEVNHTVPTLGFLVEDERSAIVIASDTAPTERLWELASRQPFRSKLGAVFLECSFPDAMATMASRTGHQCPATFASQIAKLQNGPPFHTIAVHLKAPLHDQIVTELRRLPIHPLHIGVEQLLWSLEGPQS
jgi:cAMP phosphodiesterase